MDDDFLLPQDISIGARATNEAVDLLRVGGVEQLSLNTLARAAIYSPGHFHARVGGRAGMVHMLLVHFADRWERRITNPVHLEQDLAWLPTSPGTVDGVRCWHAMIELAHGEARAGRTDPAQVVADVWRREQDYLAIALATHLKRRPTAAEILLLQAALHGLRTAIAAPVAAMTWSDARSVLNRLLSALGGAPLPDPPPETE